MSSELETLPGPRPRSPARRFLAWLSLYLLFSTVAVNAILYALPWTTPAPNGIRMVAAHETVGALVFHPRIRDNADSWGPMLAMWERIEDRVPPPHYASLLQEARKFQYPPSSLAICAGVSAISDGDAGRRLALNAIGWLAFLCSGVLTAAVFLESLRRHRMLPDLRSAPGTWLFASVLGVIATFAFYPTAKAVTLGQLQAWINCGLIGAVWLACRDRWRSIGLITGLVMLLKPQYAVLPIWAGVRGRWGLAITASILAALGTVAAIAAFGLPLHLECLEFLREISRRGENYYPNQSMNGLLHRWLRNGDSSEWNATGFAAYSRLVHVGTIATAGVLLLIAFTWPPGRRREAGPTDLAIVLMALTMASPVAWEHHYGFLPAVFAWILPFAATRPRGSAILVGLLAVSFLLTSHHYRITLHAEGTMWSPFQSYLYVGALMLFAVLLWAQRSVRASSSAPDAVDEGLPTVHHPADAPD